MERGHFITFEGIEGSGKSTQMELLAAWLSRNHFSCFTTREPGGTAIGAEIRRILLSEKTTALAPLAETFLYMADRFQHIQEVIRPQLEAYKIVLCDRYQDSTIAYQGYARKIPLDLLNFLWCSSSESIDPDLTLLFDIEPEVGIRRSLEKLSRNHLDESRFEKEQIAFHRAVREGFLALASTNPQRIVVIPGDGAIEAIHQQVVELIQHWLKSKQAS